MATLTIEGKKVTVDDSFLSLSPEQQNATVDEIAKSMGGFDLSKSVTGIPEEMSRTAGEHAQTLRESFVDRDPTQESAVGGVLKTGKGLLSAAAAIPNILLGAPARSLVGRPMAALTHAAGSVINPEVAAKDDPEQMYEKARGDVDTALSAISPRGSSPVGPRTFPAPSRTADDLRAAATAVYDDPATRATRIPPADATNLAGRIENDLLNQGFRPSTANAPGTFAELGRMVPQAGQVVSVDDLRAARRALGHIAGLRDPIGRHTPDANAATQAIQHIDNFLDNVAPQLRAANANYAAGSAAERLEYRRLRAEHRADRSGTGGNLENAMRQEVDRIPDRGLTHAERDARDRIVEGTRTRNALRTAGKLGVDGGLSLMLHSGAGLASGGSTVPVTIAGTLARKIGERLTRREIDQLSELIRSRAPLSQQTPPIRPQANRIARILAAALAGRSAPQGMIPALMPTYADQNQQ